MNPPKSRHILRFAVPFAAFAALGAVSIFFPFTPAPSASLPPHFVGFEQYRNLFLHDPIVMRPVWNAVRWWLLGVLLLTALAAAAAAALACISRKIPTLFKWPLIGLTGLFGLWGLISPAVPTPAMPADPLPAQTLLWIFIWLSLFLYAAFLLSTVFKKHRIQSFIRYPALLAALLLAARMTAVVFDGGQWERAFIALGYGLTVMAFYLLTGTFLCFLFWLAETLFIKARARWRANHNPHDPAPNSAVQISSSSPSSSLEEAPQ